MSRTGIVERAYELARDNHSIDDIRAALRKEGYIQVDEYLQDGSLRKELKKLSSREA
jgi:vacuolar-type H+-ATPase subunit I/STV1